MEGRGKKKYRVAATLSHTFHGVRPEFFPNGSFIAVAGATPASWGAGEQQQGACSSGGELQWCLSSEAKYGLWLNVRRCHAQSVGSQVFRALFFLSKLGFHMDDELLDAMADSEEGKESVFVWYESAYEEAVKSMGGEG